MGTLRSRALGLAAFFVCHGVSSVSVADNPIVQTMFTADPAPLVHDGVFYMFTGHDEDGAGWFDMREWRVFSTTDMANWTDLGSPLNLKTFKWANVDAWAAQCVFRNGQFYFYAPIRLSGDKFGIGVGVADKPEGPYTDAIGKPLIEGNAYIDPTVYVDDDGQAYMYFGNGHLWMVKLNEDMISTSGSVVDLPRTKETVDNTYGEGPWLYKRNGLYYMIFASLSEPAPGVGPEPNMENIRYSTSSSPTGPWKYRGMVMPPEGISWTNHPGMAEYKGRSYFIYHNGALPGGGNGQRSVCVEEFSYNADGTIPKITMSKTGPKQIGTLNPFQTVQAETIAFSAGLKTERCSDTGAGMNVTAISNGDYIKVSGVNFGSGASSLDVRVASGTSGGTIEVRLDSLSGATIGTCAIQATGGAQTWTTKTCAITGATGTHDLYFRFTGGSGDLFKLNWWKLTGPGAADVVDGGMVDAASADASSGARDAATDAAVNGSGGSGSGGVGAAGGQTGSGGTSSGTSAVGGRGGTTSGTGGAGGRGVPSGGATVSGHGGSGGTSSSSATSVTGGRSGGGDSGSSSSGCGCRLGAESRSTVAPLLALVGAAFIFVRRRTIRAKNAR